MLPFIQQNLQPASLLAPNKETPALPVSTGTDITIGNRSERTGRFNFVTGADGDVSFDTTEAHAVMTSAIERLGSYWADPTHGSELRTLRNLRTRTPSQAEAMTLESVAGLENSGAIGHVSAVAAANRNTGSLRVDLNWQAPGQDLSAASIEV